MNQINPWIVCMASFTVQFVVFGIQNSYGILFVSLMEEFNSSELVTAWVGTLSFCLMYFLGPIMTTLCHKLGSHSLTFAGSILTALGLFISSYMEDIRLLFLTYGLVLGIGTSMCFYSSLCILNIHFKRRLSLAYGISMSGAGFGVPVISKLYNFVITNSGWRKTIRILSVTGPLLFCCGLIFFTLRTDKGTKQMKLKKTVIVHQDHENKNYNNPPWYKRHLFVRVPQILKLLFDYKMFVKNKALRTWTISLSLILSGIMVPFVFMIRIADNIGVPRSESALLIGYLTITQAISKVVFGQIGDIKATSRITLLQIFALINAVNITLCPLAMNYAFLVVFVVVFGICDGCFAVMFSMAIHLIVGEKDMPRAFGNVCCVVALVQAVGTPLAGLIYDVFGEYNIAFYGAGGLATIGVCVAFLVPIHLSEHKDKISETEHCSPDKRNEVLANQLPAPSCPSTIDQTDSNDFMSLSGCPRSCIWEPNRPTNWV